jgi:hypothetical protein
MTPETFLHIKMLKSASKHLEIPAQVMKMIFIMDG